MEGAKEGCRHRRRPGRCVRQRFGVRIGQICRKLRGLRGFDPGYILMKDVEKMAKAVEMAFKNHPALSTILKYNEKGDLIQKYNPKMSIVITPERISEDELSKIKDMTQRYWLILWNIIFPILSSFRPTSIRSASTSRREDARSLKRCWM